MPSIEENQRILGVAKEKLNQVPLTEIRNSLDTVDSREVVADIEAFYARLQPGGEEKDGVPSPLGKLYGLGSLITANVEHATNLFIHTTETSGSAEVLNALVIASAMQPKAEELHVSTEAVYNHTLQAMQHLSAALQSFAEAEEVRVKAIDVANDLYNMRIEAIGGIDKLRDELL